LTQRRVRRHQNDSGRRRWDTFADGHIGGQSSELECQQLQPEGRTSWPLGGRTSSAVGATASGSHDRRNVMAGWLVGWPTVTVIVIELLASARACGHSGPLN